MGHGVPVFSIPGRRKDLRPKSGADAPGSNVYNPEDAYTKKNGPQYSLSKGHRDGEVGIYYNTPGAGTYQPDHSKNLVHNDFPSWR